MSIEAISFTWLSHYIAQYSCFITRGGGCIISEKPADDGDSFGARILVNNIETKKRSEIDHYLIRTFVYVRKLFYVNVMYISSYPVETHSERHGVIWDTDI